MRDVFFLDATRGPRLAVHAPGRPDRPPLLVLPPFAEELNRSRAQMNAWMTAAQALGHGSLMLDLYGTGDSAGDFGDAHWPDWEQDIRLARQWLTAHYTAAPIALCVRAGVLLAGAAACERWICWSPVVNGETWLNGFLRLRTMATRLAGGTETAADLLREAQESGTVEVAGYRLAHDWIQSLRTARPNTTGVTGLLFLDTGEPGTEPPPALKALTTLPNASWQRLAGSSFWQSVETETHPAFIEATLAWLQQPTSRAQP